MIVYPHKEKLLAAIQNRKAADDVELLQEAYRAVSIRRNAPFTL